MLGAGSAYDRRSLTCSARRPRRLRSLHSRLVAASREMFPHCSVMAGSLAFPLGGGMQRDRRWLATRRGAECDRRIAIVARGCSCLKRFLEGRRAQGGPFRRLEEQDGIAVKLDWALLSVLTNMVVDSDCITLGLFVAKVPIGGRDAFFSCALGPRAKGQVAREFQARGRESDGLKSVHKRSASHCERQQNFTWAHRLVGRLRVKARCCICLAKNTGIPYQSGRCWYWCHLPG